MPGQAPSPAPQNTSAGPPHSAPGPCLFIPTYPFSPTPDPARHRNPAVSFKWFHAAVDADMITRFPALSQQQMHSLLPLVALEASGALEAFVPFCPSLPSAYPLISCSAGAACHGPYLPWRRQAVPLHFVSHLLAACLVCSKRAACHSPAPPWAAAAGCAPPTLLHDDSSPLAALDGHSSPRTLPYKSIQTHACLPILTPASLTPPRKPGPRLLSTLTPALQPAPCPSRPLSKPAPATCPLSTMLLPALHRHECSCTGVGVLARCKRQPK